MIELLRLDLARMVRLSNDPGRVDGFEVVDGGLPPTSIVEAAAKALTEGASPLWFAPYLFVEPVHGEIVGSAIFKDAPDDGWVEIGYGVAEARRGRGHASEAIAALARLAFAEAGVRALYAETSVLNAASRRVLEKAGFGWSGRRPSEEDGLVDCWSLEAPFGSSPVPAT